MATKIKETELREMIRRVIKEQLDYDDLVPGADKQLVKFAQKVDEELESMIETLESLYEEGDELMKVDILGGHDSSAKVGERNRFLVARVSAVKNLRSSIISLKERMRHEV